MARKFTHEERKALWLDRVKQKNEQIYQDNFRESILKISSQIDKFFYGHTYTSAKSIVKNENDRRR